MVTAREIINLAREEGRLLLDLDESKKILTEAGVIVNKSTVVEKPEDVDSMMEMKYPVVLKVISKNLTHKTDIGGVRIGIRDSAKLKEAVEKMGHRIREKAPHAIINGFMVEEMVHGSELIVGSSNDAVFGPLLMVGIGGVFVEVYKDVSFRLIPLDHHDAAEMLTELRGKKILEGTRGLPHADTEELVQVLLNVSDFLQAHPEISEMDINPLMITKEGLVAVDGRFCLKEE